MVFSTLRKFNGEEEKMMGTSQIKQIAGRAGRYGSTFDCGLATTYVFGESELPICYPCLFICSFEPHHLPILRATMQKVVAPIAVRDWSQRN